MMKHFIILFISLCIVCSGCAWFETKSEKTAEDLITEGMRNFEDEDYRDAIEAFEKLKNWYPFSKFAILAELKMADAHYYLDEYELSVAEYEAFERLHPRNEAVPYVIYQIGLCYVNQMDTIDRDQTATQKALATFNRLTKQFPKDEYSVKAGEYIRKCQKNLAEHELYVGVFYYKSKYYKTALSRFETVLSDYPEIDDIHEKARHYIELCEKSLKKKQVASSDH